MIFHSGHFRNRFIEQFPYIPRSRAHWAGSSGTEGRVPQRRQRPGNAGGGWVQGSGFLVQTQDCVTVYLQARYEVI